MVQTPRIPTEGLKPMAAVARAGIGWQVVQTPRIPTEGLKPLPRSLVFPIPGVVQTPRIPTEGLKPTLPQKEASSFALVQTPRIPTEGLKHLSRIIDFNKHCSCSNAPNPD